MTRRSLMALAAVVVTAALLATGCTRPNKVEEEPDYSRQLPPGTSALRKIIDPRQLPDLSAAFQGKDANLSAALDRSIDWFAKPSSQQFYPMDGFTFDQAQTSALAFREILRTSKDAAEFQQRIRAEFDTYISVGWNLDGVVLYTGYFSPIFTASRTRTGQYQYPLYKRPSDLVADPVSGETKGRNVNGMMQTYPTRAQIEQSKMLAGGELVWLPSKLDAYIIHVNGSTRLNLTDGSTMFVGYAGNNGHEYNSIGKMLVEEGKIEKNRISLSTIREYFNAHPTELDRYTQRNDRFVFFQEYQANNWPAGSLGVKVTDLRSLATDKKIFPRGGVTLIQTTQAGAGASAAPVAVRGRHFNQFMLDQDTGGAIRAPGRADIYMGVGSTAEQYAGAQYMEGRLYYFFLKPENVAKWQQQIKAAKSST